MSHRHRLVRLPEAFLFCDASAIGAPLPCPPCLTHRASTELSVEPDFLSDAFFRLILTVDFFCLQFEMIPAGDVLPYYLRCIRNDLIQLPRALLFDMDGTITRPLLDFDQIRSEIGITGPILEAIKKMDDSDRQRAFKILDQHEISAANASTLNDGCLELMKLIDRMRFRTALITRNSRANVEIVLSLHGLRFDLIVTRDDAPPKPDPTALIQTVRNLKLNVNDCWMIGDGPHDIDAAMACNMRSIWLQHDETELLDSKPWKIVRSLHELTDFINSLTSSHSV